MSLSCSKNNGERQLPQRPSWFTKTELLYAWTGWLSGITFLLFALGFAEFAWFVRAFLGRMGLHLLLYWTLERFEIRRGEKLLRLRTALLPLFFAGPPVLLVAGLGWLAARQ